MERYNNLVVALLAFGALSFTGDSGNVQIVVVGKLKYSRIGDRWTSPLVLRGAGRCRCRRISGLPGCGLNRVHVAGGGRLSGLSVQFVQNRLLIGCRCGRGGA